MTTGQRIKARRKQLGISAEKLAEKMGISRATVYRYENGDIEKVPGDRLIPIADALSTTPAYLIGWEDGLAAEQQTVRINEFLAGSALRLKALTTCMADAEKVDGKILMDPPLQRALDDISYWTSNALKYVNEDFSAGDDPFSEENIRDQYLSAIRKMSVEDQYRWLVRIQDYVDENQPINPRAKKE